MNKRKEYQFGASQQPPHNQQNNPKQQIQLLKQQFQNQIKQNNQDSSNYSYGDSQISPTTSTSTTMINRKCAPPLPGQPQEVYPMGGYLIPSSETRLSRVNIDTIDGQPGVQPYDIRVLSRDYQPMERSQNGSTRVTRMSPNYASFDLNDNNINQSKFEQSLMDSEQRISTGVLVNTNSGQMFETFEDDMPPPNLSRERDYFPHQLNQTNPFLIYSNGGVDPNREPRNKQEVFAYQPDESDGPNVWGDQLFSQRRRAELEMRAQRDTWQNRNGDYSIEPVNDRRPVGYVGFQPASRYFPYMPPTKRTFIDSKTYTGHANNDQFTDPHWTELIGPNHHIKSEEDVLTIDYTGQANAADNGSYVQTILDPQVRITETNRSKNTANAVYNNMQIPGTISSTTDPTGVRVQPVNNEVRPTLKPVTIEKMFGSANCASDSTGTYVVIDKNIKDTLKGLMSTMFPIANASNDTNGTTYVLIDKNNLRQTLKPVVVEKTFSSSNAGSDSSGSYVILDKTVKATLKPEVVEKSFNQFLNVYFDTNIGSYVVADKSIRDTLKTALMETNFVVAPISFDESTGGYVVMDSNKPRDTLKVETMEKAFGSSNVENDITGPIVVIDKTLKDTLKTQLEQMFSIANASPDQKASYIVSDDFEVRNTLKTQLEQMFSITNASPDQSASYVVSDKEVRHTLKPLLENMFGITNASDTTTGSWIPFQGPYRSTKRKYYENKSQRPAIDTAAAGLFADQIRTISQTKAIPNRGSKNEINYVYGPNKIVEDAKDTSSRSIGHTERVVNRETCARYTAPIKIVEQDERVVPMLQTRNANKESFYYGDPEFDPNYFTSTQANASTDCKSYYYQNQNQNQNNPSLFFTTDGSNDEPETMNYITNITMPVQQIENN